LQFPGDPSGEAADVINCFPAGTAIEGKVVGGLKADYSGQFREIVTRRGHRLTVTPNHPILTAEGWVPAHSLTEGSHLFSKTGAVEPVALGVVRDDKQHGPARIEQVFDAMARDGRVAGLKVSALDLHGDALGTEGRVHVVRADGALQGHSGIEDRDGVKDGGFAVSESGECVGDGLGAPHALGYGLLAAPARGVGGGNLLSDAGGVALESSPLHALRIGLSAHRDPVFAQASKEDSTVVSGFVRELLETHAGDVAVDEIVEIRDFNAAGHIYDLQTVDGWMIAQGIVTSNCRCVLAYYDEEVAT